MKFVSADALRKGEGDAIRQTPGLALDMMNRAGKGLARAIASILEHLAVPGPTVRFLAGPGNNGGDAFVAAVQLDQMGIACEVWLTCEPDRIKGTAREAFDEMEAVDAFSRYVAEDEWEAADALAPAPAILVDALLGTGAAGEPRGNIRRAVEYLRARRDDCLVVAADIPTGMNADTGESGACAVQADFTVTMGWPKPGMMFAEAREPLGSLGCVPIGLPAAVAEALPDARPDLQWISPEDVRRILPRRGRQSHKGTWGRTLLAGGSAQYPGAMVLATEGAVRSGAGLVQAACSPAAAAAIVARCPEAIAGPGLSAEIPLDGMDSILLGPGLGRDPEARRLVARLLHETPCPLVLDADAIAVLAGKPEAIRGCPKPVVLTPHPGELALLLGSDVSTVQQDRLVAAEEAAERTGAIVVLKGAGTLVVQSGKAAWINLNGNPGMACGGSGDVLAGLLAGLIAQGLAPFDAACAGVWLHGTAGDVAALRNTQAAMSAGDIARALPAAFRQATIR